MFFWNPTTRKMPPAKSSRQRPTRRLVLEALESRTLLSGFTVDRLTDNDPAGGGEGAALAGDLRYCLTQAGDGDAIAFGVTGTIKLVAALPDLTQNISIAGPGADLLTVSGNHVSRVFNIAAGADVAISGLTIADGTAPAANGGGGGIYNAGTLAVTDSTLSDNTTFSGGGIDNLGTLTVTGSTISGNVASAGGAIASGRGTVVIMSSTLSGNFLFDLGYSFGGGIDNSGMMMVVNSTVSGNFGNTGGGIFNGGTLTVSNSTLSGNLAVFGGGIGNLGTTTVTDSVLGDNSAAANGGGIINYGGGRLSITNSALSGNAAFIVGAGAIDNYTSSTVTIASSTLSGNVTGGAGGGIRNAGTLTVTNSTLSRNAADNGGGLLGTAGTATVTSSTLSGNFAAATGGGIDQTGSGRITLRNTLVAGNTAPASPDVDGSLDSHGHNLIGDGSGGLGYADTDLVGTADNPIDPLLGPLQDNGGPTLTMALLPGSPARTAGDPRGAPAWDQRGPGFPRVVDGAIDIGAYEVQEGQGVAAHRRPQAPALAAPLAAALPLNAPVVFPPVVVATPHWSIPLSAWPAADAITAKGFQAAPWTWPAAVSHQARDIVFAELGSAAVDVLSLDG
jgi:hypothetical protein